MRKTLIIIFLPVLILLASYNSITYDLDFYKNEFEKHGVYEQLAKEDVDREAQNIINYLKDGIPLEVNFFNEKEVAHMSDVYNTNRNFSYLFYISLTIITILVLSLFYSKDYKIIFDAFFKGSILTLSIILLLLIVFTLNFTGAFTIFHEVFFDNELWKLNPEYDKMIIMFPEGFFFDSVIAVVIRSSIIAALLLLAIIIKRKYFKLNRFFNKSFSK